MAHHVGNGECADTNGEARMGEPNAISPAPPASPEPISELPAVNYPLPTATPGGHPESLTRALPPMLVIAAVNGFFSGRGQTWTVLGIDAVGTAVNASLSLVLIFGRLGFPEMGIEGAGLATVIGSWASALFALVLLFRRRYREQYRTLAGWKPERELTGRLLRFGGPNGLQMFLDVLAFTLFT